MLHVLLPDSFPRELQMYTPGDYTGSMATLVQTRKQVAYHRYGRESGWPVIEARSVRRRGSIPHRQLY